MKKKSLKSLHLLLLVLLISNLSFSQEDKSYLNPPKLIRNPSLVENYSVENRKFTGISSLAVSPKGRMWAVWYSGSTPDEDLNNYIVVSTSEDKGKSWEEVLVIDPEFELVRAFDPEVWIDPEGHLWIFWSQSLDHEMNNHSNGQNTGVWTMTIKNAEESNPTWPAPKRITDGIMMCKPIVLSSGEWVLPVSTWRIKDGAKMVVSTDNGQSWQIRGAVNVPQSVWSSDEHMIVERKDETLWMLVRTQYGIGESISKDKGYSWSSLVPSKIQHTTSRFFIYGLNSGNLLLVKHGPIDMRIGRSHLMAFVSEDDGQSWSDGLLLDERPGVSYPDGQQTSDGTIYITYDYNRTKEQQILVTSFTEDDVIFGTNRSLYNVFQQRKIISQGGMKNQPFKQ